MCSSDLDDATDFLRVVLNSLYFLANGKRPPLFLSLEDKLNEIDEPFLHNSLMLVVDSVDSEKVRKAMETELEQLDERHALDRRFYEKAASFAPAFGMIGTLVGLILMLGNMSDVDALAKGMAVALITTLYGSLLANVVCLPMASKLKARHDEEFLCKQLVMEGVLAIQDRLFQISWKRYKASSLSKLVIATKRSIFFQIGRAHV